MKTFAAWLAETTDYFQSGSFGPANNGKHYSVIKVVRWAEKTATPTLVNIRRIIPHLLGGKAQTVEPIGSTAWQSRANRADLSKPILIVRSFDGSGIWVADGQHRLWQKYHAGDKKILAYVVNEKDLPQEAIVEKD